MRSQTPKAILFNTIPILLCIVSTIIFSITIVDLDIILPATIGLIILLWVTLGGYFNGVFFKDVKNYIFALPLIVATILFSLFVIAAGTMFSLGHNGTYIGGIFLGLYFLFASGAIFAVFLVLIAITAMITFAKLGKSRKHKNYSQ